MQIIATFTALPPGVYILFGSVYINSTPFTSNIQFGTNGTVQNSDLQNIASVTSSASAVVRLTGLWVQSSAINVYFSAAGVYNFQNIGFYYVRIA